MWAKKKNTRKDHIHVFIHRHQRQGKIRDWERVKKQQKTNLMPARRQLTWGI